MEPIRRQCIELKKCPDDYKEVLKEFGYEYEPVVACPTWRQFKNTGAPIRHCAANCSRKCGRFMTFQWVIDQCDDPYCGPDHPCFRCVSQIKKAKVLVSVAILTHFSHANSIGAMGRYISEVE